MNYEAVKAVLVKVHSNHKHSRKDFLFLCLVNVNYAGHCFVFMFEKLLIFEFALDGSSGDAGEKVYIRAFVTS